MSWLLTDVLSTGIIVDDKMNINDATLKYIWISMGKIVHLI